MRGREFSCLVKKMTAVLFSICLFSGAAVASEDTRGLSARHVHPPGDNVNEMFMRAVDEDLSGQHSGARAKYDALKESAIAPYIRVPSAVNLVMLSRYDEAMQAFESLMRNGNKREQDYARLWDLWLTAKTWTGDSASLQKKLSGKASDYKWSSAYESAIAGIYAGEGTEQHIFELIDMTHFRLPEEKADAMTQAVFFIGGYYQYVAGTPKKARNFYSSHASRLNNLSLERNLILKEQAFINQSE